MITSVVFAGVLIDLKFVNEMSEILLIRRKTLNNHLTQRIELLGPCSEHLGD